MSKEEVVLKPQTVEMASTFKKKIKIDKEGVAQIPEDLYESTLETAGLDAGVVKKVQQHNTEVVTALTLAVGEAGLEAMKKNGKLEQVTGEAKLGRDEVEILVNRTREVNDMKNPGNKITQFGATTVKYTVKGTGNSGELKKVRQHIMNNAAKLLASD